MSRPPLPPFNETTAIEKVRLAEDGWNTRDPAKVALAYTPDSQWRNRAEFFSGREAIQAFLTRKWNRELDYRLIKELWTFAGNRIAVRFAYEYHDDSNHWFRAYGNENWEFVEDGLMRRRIASINEHPITEADRKYHWPLGRRPDDYPSLSQLWLLTFRRATSIIGRAGSFACTASPTASGRSSPQKVGVPKSESSKSLGTIMLKVAGVIRHLAEHGQPEDDMPDKKTIQPYDQPAGGWGALKALGERLVEQGIPVKGAATLLRMNQPQGFDCPGCAWPDPKHTSSFEFCENGGQGGRLGGDGEALHAGILRRAYRHASSRAGATTSSKWSGRLTHPMAYDAATDRYLPVSWDEAFATIGRHLNGLPDPNMAEFYTSGRTSNEAAFLYQLFVREYGTNNFPDCSNMCHEATSVGLPQSLGVGKGTVPARRLRQDRLHLHLRAEPRHQQSRA